MTLFGRRIPMMTSLIFWLLVWEIVGRLEVMFLIPPITSIVAAGLNLVQTASWQSASLITLRAFIYGMALAIVVGVPLGVLMGRVRVIDNIFGLWVNMFVSAPLSALVPILMILFGMGETTVVVTVFLFAVWIIVLDARAGVMQAPTSLIEMGRSYGASRWTIFTKIILLSALPEILAGIRIGLIRGVKGVVIGQILVSIIGYGELFELYSRSFDMERFWALTMLLFAAAMLLSAGVEHFEKRIEYYAGVR
ncbi:ABC transporter permease [Phyllobacterium endophyticum]|uniref:ABC transporter permease n=1 Tax=Phyllobacterium endophyticum TaxID=1149773 RepID=A0A2P7APA9_9HYPH|nr:ABC transporter permease subunit [Phyllobacterium endophyticum]MBB3233580.1 NitT/TauT family transport system permease protein [Phyllobacterium endophyticum]PSH56051.1 ABC transporter permease [Phyllobacterium endophyticum]TXR47271.1 ABC transporter permease subunit [Phyllobacterium endophyticum]TYR41201.1 ABC transporter permease subunit [Phyllobacterium endophyticum]